MEFEEIVKFAEWENRRIEEASGKSNEDLIFSQVLKLGEEYGEFINEFLKVYGWQRKNKMEDVDIVKEKMAEEFTDVILVSLLAGKRLGIDIEEEIKKKIKKVKNRDY